MLTAERMERTGETPSAYTGRSSDHDVTAEHPDIRSR